MKNTEKIEMETLVEEVKIILQETSAKLEAYDIYGGEETDELFEEELQTSIQKLKEAKELLLVVS